MSVSWQNRRRQYDANRADRKYKRLILTRKLSYRKDDRAMRRMYGCPENFREFLTTPTATIPDTLMGFCSD